MINARLSRSILLAIVIVSAFLRIAMCMRGGQYFFGDEIRYEIGVRLYAAVAHGDSHSIREVVAQPEHALFPWVSALAAGVQHLLAQATPYGDWRLHRENVVFTTWLGASFLSLFSALNVLLVYGLARVLGVDREEALWATLLMSVSNTAFYFARHLLSFDCALAAALGALLAGLGAPSAGRAALCGFLAGCAYHLYNGYWYLPPVVGFVFIGVWWTNPRRSRLALAWGGGLAIGIGAPLLAGTMAGGFAYWRTMMAFSKTVTQGLFAEGWSLPWAYLWYSEEWLGVGVVACIVSALILAWRRKRPLEPRIRAWLAALGAAYGLMVLFSVFLEKFVVYGRTVKPLVPLFCLAGGWALRTLIADRAWLKVTAAAALVACGVVHFVPHFTRVFQRDVEIEVLRSLGNPKHSLSTSGSIYITLVLPVTRPDLALVNAQFIYPIRGYIGYPEGETVFRVEHPLNYRPFQYEGHSPAERALLRTDDISIRLIKLRHPSQVPDDLPFPLRYQNGDRPTGLQPSLPRN